MFLQSEKKRWVLAIMEKRSQNSQIESGESSFGLTVQVRVLWMRN